MVEAHSTPVQVRKFQYLSQGQYWLINAPAVVSSIQAREVNMEAMDVVEPANIVSLLSPQQRHPIPVIPSVSEFSSSGYRRGDGKEGPGRSHLK